MAPDVKRTDEVFRRVQFGPATLAAGFLLSASILTAFLAPAVTVPAIFIGATIWFLWVLTVWPQVTLGPRVVVVRNSFSTASFAYREIRAVNAGLSLDIEVEPGRRVRVWAIPGQRNLGVEAMRVDHAYNGGFTPVRRVDDLRVGAATTPASRVAAIIMRRIELDQSVLPGNESGARPMPPMKANALTISLSVVILAVASTCIWITS